MRAFFEGLFGAAEEGLYTYLWTLPDKRTYAFRAADAAGMAKKAQELDALGRDVYFGVGLTEKPCGSRARAKTADIAAVPALWLDVDLAGGAHARETLPPNRAAALAALEDIARPTFVVASGGGLHLYFVFKEPLSAAEGAELLQRYQGYAAARFRAKGWHLDNTADLPRVLRVPGTHNYKKPREAREVRVCEADTGRVYDAVYFDFLPPVGALGQSERRVARRGGFVVKDTDGSVAYLTKNCAFIQQFLQTYKTADEPTWKTAGTNLVRAAGGAQLLASLVEDWQGERYSAAETQKKLDHWLNDCHPETCARIQQLGLSSCTSCVGVKSPCAWATGAVGRAVAQVRAATEKLLAGEAPAVLGDADFIRAARTAEREAPEDFGRFREACRGKVNLNELKAALTQARRQEAEEQVRAVGGATTQAAVPDCPVSLQVPPGFSFEAAGVKETRLTGKGEPIVLLACAVPLVITRSVRNLDDATIKVEIAFKRGGRWIYALVERSTLFSARGIVQLADRGLMVSSETAKVCVRYLLALESVNRDLIEEVLSVSTVGWRGHCQEFVLPSSADYIVDLEDGGEVTGAFTQTGSFAAWKRQAQEVRRAPFARFLLAAAFAPVLLAPLQARNFVTYLWGKSGGGKTAALYMAMSVWGDPRRLVRSFLATANGLERAAEMSNDFPLAINERQVATGVLGRQDALESLVYMVEGGRGKVRASKAGIRRTAQWRTIALATGEEPLSQDNSVQGVKTRLVELCAAPVLPDALARSIYGFTGAHHGHAGPAFVARLLAEGFAGVRADFEGLNERLLELFPEHFAPHVANVALVAVADLYASQWLFGEPEAQAAQAAFDLTCTVLSGMTTRKEIEDAPRILTFVQNWYASNVQHFAGAEGFRDRPPLAPEFGFVEEEEIYIYQTVFKHALKDEGFAPNKAMQELANLGAIETYTEKSGKLRFSVVKRRNKKPTRVVHLLDVEEEEE